MANLIHEKIEPEAIWLFFNIVLHHPGEVLDGNAVFLPVLVNDAPASRFVTAGHLCIGPGDILRLEDCLLPAFKPRKTGFFLVGFLEFAIEAAIVELSFELGDMTLFAIVAAHLIKNLYEYGKKRVHLSLADDICLLVDIEKDAFRRNPCCLLEAGLKDAIVAAFRQEQIQCTNGVNFSIFKNNGQHLQQVRLARTEKPGYPDAVCPLIVIVGI